MAIGDIYQLNCNQSLYGVPMANVYTFEQLSDVDPGEDPENSLIEAFEEHIVPLQAAMSSDRWSTTCLTCRKLRPTGGVRFLKPVVEAGTILLDAIAPNTCCLASMYSLTAGPRGRGRHWYSGIASDSQSAGRLDGSSLTVFDAFLARLIQSISWASDNADFILRIISSLDAVVRTVDKTQARVRVRYLASRRDRIC